MGTNYQKKFKLLLNELVMVLAEIQTDNDIVGLMFISHVCLNLMKKTSEGMRLQIGIPKNLLN
jgi:hypothetical protein